MANGMSSLFVGVTGLQSAQTALNTTAHNISNINTEGYTRQQVTFSDTDYMVVNTGQSTTVGTTGLGVTISEVRRVRDEFIDRAYRSENARLGFYDNMEKAVNEVEDLFGEMQGVTYQESLTELYDSVSELRKNPSSTVSRSSLIQYATGFLDRSTSIYQGLKEYQVTLNTEVENYVNTINELGNKIYSLNKSIAAIESAGVEDANDLRDQRDAALDELSEYVKIDYYENSNSEVTVSIESAPFVTIGCVTEMNLRQVEGSTLLIPTWDAYGRDVYQTYGYDNSDNTDMGALKGILIARGVVEVNYESIPVMPSTADYDLTTAEGLAAYNEAYAEYQEAQEYYDAYIEPSPILCALAGLDRLVNGIVESINDVLCPEKELTLTSEMTDDDGNVLQADTYTYSSVDADVLYDRFGNAVEGKDNGDGSYSYSSGEKLYRDELASDAVAYDSVTYKILDMDATDYGMDEDKSVGVEIFKRYNTDRYITRTAEDGTTMYVRNNLNINGYESKYTLGNMEMNGTATQNVATIALSTLQGGEDFAKANELLDLWDVNFASLNPESYAKSNFNTFYNNFISEFATAGNVLDNYTTNQQTMVDSFNNQRLMIEGVSSDEELEKMIKYQQAYNAASRYINVVSEMLEHLVTSLGNA